jgi:hypothetical protein
MRRDRGGSQQKGWSTAFLFGDYLFNKNVTIMVSMETIFTSLVIICKGCIEAQSNQLSPESAVAREHRLRMLNLLQCTIDFYDIMFRHLRQELAVLYTQGSAKIPQYLNTIKVVEFFKRSGESQFVASNTSKRKQGRLDFKIFKIIADRSDEFSQFIKFVADKGRLGENMMNPACQYISIIAQLLAEGEAKQKQLEEEAKREEENRLKKLEEMEQIVPVETDHPPSPVLASTPSQHKKKVFGYEQKVRNQSEAILFEGEDEEEEEQTVHVPRRKISAQQSDPKTREYLDYIRKFQYEDEYDDTHDHGEGPRKRGRGEARRGRGRRGGAGYRKHSSSEEASEEDRPRGPQFEEDTFEHTNLVVEESDDSLDEYDPMNTWERTQSRQDRETLEGGESTGGGPIRGRMRGGVERGGKRDMKREKYNSGRGGFNREAKNYNEGRNRGGRDGGKGYEDNRADDRDNRRGDDRKESRGGDDRRVSNRDDRRPDDRKGEDRSDYDRDNKRGGRGDRGDRGGARDREDRNRGERGGRVKPRGGRDERFKDSSEEEEEEYRPVKDRDAPARDRDGVAKDRGDRGQRRGGRRGK